MTTLQRAWGLLVAPGVKVNPFKEIMASVVVFLVALPLCMGIAIASGVPPALGLVSGIVGGLVVGWLAGSPLQVSGPAAGLAVLVFEFVGHYGLAALGMAVFLAGIVQLVAGVARLGRWFRATSPAVIRGMLAGIGVLIFASQFHVMLDDKPLSGGLENLLYIPSAIVKGVPTDGSVHHLAAGIGIITIATIVLWTRFRPKALRFVPGALLAVLVASGVAVGFAMPITYVDVPTSLAEGLNWIQFGDITRVTDTEYLVDVFAIALIASAETLLCATAVDRLHDGPRTNYDRELAAQGVGNMICGLFGALPMTGVIVRSSANVDAGATTRFSAILHGVWLLVLVAALPFVLGYVPRAALAGILVYTGWKLMNLGQIATMWKQSRVQLGIWAITVCTIVATDLLTGVILGLVLSAGVLLWQFSRLDIRERRDGNDIDVNVAGAATFVSLPRLAEALESLPKGSDVHLHLGELSYVDPACSELLDSWARNHEAGGGSVSVAWDQVEEKQDPNLVFSTSRPQGDPQGRVPPPEQRPQTPPPAPAQV